MFKFFKNHVRHYSDFPDFNFTLLLNMLEVYQNFIGINCFNSEDILTGMKFHFFSAKDIHF